MSTHDLPAYAVLHAARSRFETLRGLRYHLWEWGEPASAGPTSPTLVMVHGWADVGASFQFAVDALARHEGRLRHVVAPDWRGFGQSANSGSDAYWFADYLGDLDALIDRVSPDAPVDLLGHSMGGNVVMSYAGARPLRVRRLINLEGFGLPQTRPEQAPKRLAQWLDDLKMPQGFKGFGSLAEVAARLQANNPRLGADKAAWLAPHWAAPDADGRWHVRCDPAHKRVNPMLYRVDEILATWTAIRAPLLWVEGELTDLSGWWGARYSKAEFHERLTVVPELQRHTLGACGHMLHHDQPEALAALLAAFLNA
ncbi:MAG: alpha/beta hydrolase [Rubrivivax sp.]|nr:alpha/beta hydrolase [Rubrivivax sp.]